MKIPFPVPLKELHGDDVQTTEQTSHDGFSSPQAKLRDLELMRAQMVDVARAEYSELGALGPSIVTGYNPGYMESADDGSRLAAFESTGNPAQAGVGSQTQSEVQAEDATFEFDTSQGRRCESSNA